MFCTHNVDPASLIPILLLKPRRLDERTERSQQLWLRQGGTSKAQLVEVVQAVGPSAVDGVLGAERPRAACIAPVVARAH